MKVIHVSTSDIEGGASRATFRLNNAINKNTSNDIQSSLCVLNKISDDKTIFSNLSRKSQYFFKLKSFISIKLQQLQLTNNSVLHSSSFFSSSILNSLEKSDADLIHLHWVQGEMLSIEDIGRIKKPVIWTLHDAWAFCGSEHYPKDYNDKRYIEGYLKDNRDLTDSGIDLDMYAWHRKKKNWNREMNIVCPSNWLKECVQNSKLMSNWPVKVIPNTLPTNIYKPWPKSYARQLFDLPQDMTLILFGALNATTDKRKGWDLLKIALSRLSKSISPCSAVVFGESGPLEDLSLGMPIFFMGRLYDDQSLALLYSAADVMIVPSLMESFGQTASEAQSCGLPVVAFDTSGLKDIVEHQKTGFLGKRFDPLDLVAGVEWVLEDDDRYNLIRQSSLNRAKRLWSPEVVADKYVKLYQEVLEK
tara:strand:+ start:16078 stop:17331 length:1254 start_codon:yes stop_codon:yes gene_type:complete